MEMIMHGGSPHAGVSSLQNVHSLITLYPVDNALGEDQTLSLSPSRL